MSQGEQPIEIESIPLREVAEALRRTRPFAETDVGALSGVEVVDRVKVNAGGVLVEPGQPLSFYWLVLEGEVRAERPEPDGTRTVVGMAAAGDGFGETPLLTGKTHWQRKTRCCCASPSKTFGRCLLAAPRCAK